jgi:hypothetical protein
MFGKSLVLDMIDRSAETPTDRRNFLRAAGLAGFGAVGAGVAFAGPASAAIPDDKLTDAQKVSDAAVLNFALNLEYLEAEFYSFAFYGKGLADADTDGTLTRGPVVGGKQVPFKDGRVKAYAEEIANDEIAHVKFLRAALGGAKVSRPKIDLQESFTAAARAAKVVGPTATFDPFADDNSFLLGAYIFEDVGVTAYKGAAPLVNSNTFLEAAAGILAVEAYHAGLVRSQLYRRDLGEAANKISDARDFLDGDGGRDEGVLSGRLRTKRANLVPTDENSIALSRSTGEVLNVVYLTPGKGVTKGGFFPDGANNIAALTTT